MLRRVRSCSCTLLGLFAAALGGCAHSPGAPDSPAGAGEGAPREAKSSDVLVIHHARIYGHPEASAVQIIGEKISQVGDESLLADRAARTVDAEGGWLLPGFHDAHLHLLGGGLSLAQAQLGGATTLEAALGRVKDWALAHPDAPWVLGRGWSYDLFGKGVLPTAALLDAIIPDRPVALEAYDGHSYWLNSQALKLAKIDRNTAAPPGGTIVKDAGGQPTGALLEDAEDLLEAALPEPTRVQQKEALLAACAYASALGITAVDAIETHLEELSILHELEAEGRLPLQVNVFLPIAGDHDAYVAMKQHDTPQVRLQGVKGFVDGVVESKTAFMLQPYEGSSERGRPLLAKEQLFPLVESAHVHGLQVLLHSIGDGAVRLALDAYQAALLGHPELPRIRHRVEHIEVIDPADLPRFAQLGVVASMQPYHAVPYGPDPDQGAWSENLGAERRRRSFAWRMLVQAQAPLTFGSDWPVFTADPLLGVAVALTRQNEAGLPKEGWNAHQTLSLGPALAAYTVERGGPLGPATTVGSIDPGQEADLVLLSPEVDLDAPLTLFHAARRQVFRAGQPLAPFGLGAPFGNGQGASVAAPAQTSSQNALNPN